jgi:SAM-dependent methyltransferase
MRQIYIENCLKRQCSGTAPEFLRRLSENEISNHPCFNCLRETEQAVEKGYWKKFSKPLFYWYEMCQAERDELTKFMRKFQPKTILELGCGSGRIINIFLKFSYKKIIYAMDKDQKIIKIIEPLYKNIKDLHIIHDSIDNFLNKKKVRFDLAVLMMNTVGNIDDQKILESIARNSTHFIFTAYDQRFYKLRNAIYRSKGHRKFFVKNKTYYFNDCWVKGLKSRSYSRKELDAICKNICKGTSKKYEIKKISKLLFWVHIFEC